MLVRFIYLNPSFSVPGHFKKGAGPLEHYRVGKYRVLQIMVFWIVLMVMMVLRRVGKYVLLLLVAALVSACGPPYEEDSAQLFGDQLPAFETYSINDRTIHYVEVGNREGSPLLFLHGTPGSWRAFGSYLSDSHLAGRLNMVAVDRPGFGRSDYGNLLPSLSEQSLLFKPLLERLAHTCRVTLVGHSLGAPLAVRMAMDFPDKIGALVLVAPSLDPDLEKPRWYNNLADYQVVSWLLPTDLVLANHEVMVLPQELEKMVPLWASLDLPITVIQGQKDKLVSRKNADFAEKMVPRGLKVVRLEEAGHFVLWNQPDLIKSEILHLLDTRLPEDSCFNRG